MAKLLWQPFNIRFGGFLEQLSIHRSVLSEEVQLAHILINVEASIASIRVEKTEVLEKNPAEEPIDVEASIASIRAEKIEVLEKNAAGETIDVEASIASIRAEKIEVLEKNAAEEAKKLAILEDRLQTEMKRRSDAMDCYQATLKRLQVANCRASETQLLAKEMKLHLEEEYKGMFCSEFLQVFLEK